MSGHLAIYSMLTVMVLLWSVNYTVARVALREFPPLLLTGIRTIMAAAVLFPVYWRVQRRGTNDRWTRQDAPFLVVLGLFGVALNQLLFMVGLSRTSVAHAAIIAATGPLLILLIAALMGLERLNTRKTTGMCVALAGVVLLKMFEHQPARGQGPTWTGDLTVLAGTCCFALFTVYGKRASTSHNAITVVTFGYLAGTVLLAPFTIWQAAAFPFARISAAGWFSMAYIVLFPSVLCYLIYYHALTHIAASRVAAFSYLQPVLVATLGALLLHEPVTVPLVAAGSVVFTGVYLTERG